MKRNWHKLIWIFLPFLMASCTSGYDLASNYVASFGSPKNAPDQKLYVCLPHQILHTNSKAAETPGFSDLPDDSKKYLEEKTALFLPTLNDSVMLNQFNEHFLYNLSLLGMPLYVVPTPEDLPVPDSGRIFTINVVQLEAQEYTVSKTVNYEDEYMREYFEEQVPLNAFSLNGWFLFNEKDTSKGKLLYKNFEVVDKLSAQIRPDSKGNNAQLKYTVKKINLNDVYFTAFGLGKLSATLFIEKFVNDYVDSRMQGNSSYYFFDSDKKDIETSTYKSSVRESYFLQELPNK